MNLVEKRTQRRKIVVGSMIAGNLYMSGTLAAVTTGGGLGPNAWLGYVIAAWSCVFWGGVTYLVHRRMR